MVFRTTSWCPPNDASQPCYAPEALAITSVFVDKANGRIIDGDIEVNAKNFIWTDLDTDPATHVKQDLQNALTHEMGHLAGLDHTCFVPPNPDPLDDTGTPVPDCNSAPEAVQETTMFASAIPGDTAKRTLAPDDVQAICDVYPIAKDPMLCPVKDEPPAGTSCRCSTSGRPGGAARAGAIFGALAVFLSLRRRRAGRPRGASRSGVPRSLRRGARRLAAGAPGARLRALADGRPHALVLLEGELRPRHNLPEPVRRDVAPDGRAGHQERHRGRARLERRRGLVPERRRHDEHLPPRNRPDGGGRGGDAAPAAWDGRNSIIFRTESWSKSGKPGMDYPFEALAVTTVTARLDGHIVDTDMEINGVSKDWMNLDPGYSVPFDHGAIHDVFDLQNALTHEFGHFIGLDHTCYIPSPTNPLVSDTGKPRPNDDKGNPVPDCDGAPSRILEHRDVQLGGPPGDAAKRVLSDDDRQAICDIYPASRDAVACALDSASPGCALAAERPRAGRRRPLGLALGLGALALLGVVALGRRARRR